MRKIVILGSTGSIGVNALNVIRQNRDRFRVMGLSANSNIELLEKQIDEFRPLSVAVAEAKFANRLSKKLGSKNKVLTGQDGLNQLASLPGADLIVVAISGSFALLPLFSAIDAGKQIALANKESLVMAGHIITGRTKTNGANIVPVDSEHCAIFQCLNKEDNRHLKKIYLTGSGGPLLKAKSLKDIRPEYVLAHPKWKMGKKITVDSATFMNKGFEIMEAKWLFGVDVGNIDVLIHPEAVVHSMVEFIDGSILAQMGITDMRIPIQYALGFPERLSSFLPSVDFFRLKRLTFLAPDLKKFPCLKIAIRVAKEGGSLPAVLSASDEVLVDAFLKEKIKFLDIPKILEKVLAKHKKIDDPTLEQVLEVDMWAREATRCLF